jgi:hypothetical protein
MSLLTDRYGSGDSGFARVMSDQRLAEIRAHLEETPPVASIRGRGAQSPVASYLRGLRNDLSDLLKEVDRLRAGTSGDAPDPYDWEDGNPQDRPSA